ncbi:MAG: PKD domain-containing protein [Nannocystaceae bacterium]|nr:PKD domain-containing protein [Nannocystaceae bacterium]
MCQLAITDVRGLEQSGAIVRWFRVRGTAGDCKLVDVEVVVAGRAATGAATVAQDGTWQVIVEAPGPDVRCRDRASIRATCRDVAGCSAVAWENRAIDCERVPDCAYPTDIVMTGTTCAGSGLRTTVRFEVRLNTAAPSGTRYFWKFGDEPGPVPVSQRPSRLDDPSFEHEYETPGNVSVEVVVRRDGCDDEPLSVPLTIPPCCPALTSLVVTDETCANDGTTAIVGLFVRTDPEGAPGVFSWDFGDGTPHETSSAPTKQHAFVPGRSYAVTVSFTPSSGAPCGELRKTQSIDVGACGPPACPFLRDVEMASEHCVANADGTADGVASVTLVATTEPADAGGTYEWDFGDGTPAVTGGPRADHNYATAGDKLVRVRFRPRDSRCPPTSVERKISVSACGKTPAPTTTAPPDETCLFWLIMMLLIMAVGALLLGVGLCLLFMSLWQAGILLTGLGVLLLLIGFVIFVGWLLLCATASNNCLLLDLLIDFLLFLAGASWLISIAVLVLGAFAGRFGLCFVGPAIDGAYFSALASIAYWWARFVGCRPWPRWVPGWARVSLPAAARGGLDEARSRLHGP